MRLPILLVLLLCACANDPYYASGLSLGGYSKDGALGAAIGISFQPNPAYRLPRGYAK